ncbi:MAG TPA: FAD-binding oxidoreductase [Candidatus Limnocylindrales bacterium]|nr:FAD-binding oxidoreductase [Candidatus Limnocylindrales bacterium]
MTAPTTDERPIAPTSPLYNSRLVRREDLTDALCIVWVAMDGEPLAFEPGQYLTIGVESNGRIVQRPFSVASSPRKAADGYEFYVRLVENGMFTPLLWRLPVGHGLRTIGPKGKFMLEPNDERTHVFISSGTGIAPFIAMMDTLRLDGLPRKAVVLHGCSYIDELGYREHLESWQRSGAYPVAYVPTISRPHDPRNVGWDGRTGRVETILDAVLEERGLTADNAIAYVCGNPDMILSAEARLLDRGFPEAQIKKELYWPKGKAPKAGAMGAAPAGD